jgi:hypothetical protein
MLFGEMIGYYCDNYKKSVNGLCGKVRIFLMLQRVVRIVTTGF